MQNSDKRSSPDPTTSPAQILSYLREHLPELALLLVLLLAAYLRFVGINWDEGTQLHPDERFLLMVEGALQLPSSLGEYFNTDVSKLNPHNVGYGFFVYGTFPIFIVRYLWEWVGQIGNGDIRLLGRAVSASFDLISIGLIYLIGKRLYRRRVGLFAALFVGLSVLLIQHAHFFVVDSVANVFILTGFYFAVRVMDEGRPFDYLLFGLSLGMAVASKINTAPLAGVVALAGLIRVWRANPEVRQKELYRVIAFLAAAAVISLVTFRVLQPYAFTGPSFFDVSLNPQWLSNMQEINEINRGNTDAPYALQWADRTPVLHSLKNMLLWGMGLPLGVVAWLGWAWAAWEIVRKRNYRHLLPVIWTGAYFVWQSIGFTPAMRYQMPVYPTLALMAAWGLWRAWDTSNTLRPEWRKVARALAGVVAGVTILGTLIWALAFTNIYREPLTRVDASRWIYTHLPGTVNVVMQTEGEEIIEVVPMPSDFTLDMGSPHVTSFKVFQDGSASAIRLPYVINMAQGDDFIDLTISLLEFEDAEDALGFAVFDEALSPGNETFLEIPLHQPIQLTADRIYYIKLELEQGGPLSMRGTRIIHETTWDDGMPWSVDGRSMSGRYVGLNQELYWADDEDTDGNGISDKLERIATTLTEGDFLIISSKRQYGSIPRVPIRYPLTTAYYRALLSCPESEDVLTCAATAKPGEIQNELGYELVKIFQSNPKLGPLEINDQSAEETFTVYDHPKVLVFQKTESYSESSVRDILGQVDLSNVVHILPRDVGSTEVSTDLMLPADQWEEQQESGTWADIFNRQSLINRSGFVGIVVWWITIGLVGLLAFPITRVAFPGLQDGGYPLARVIGVLIMAWGSWLLGSVGVPVTRLTIAVVLLLMAAISLALAYRDREALIAYFREHRKEILFTEILALAFFLFDMGIRIGNPDLWHPSKGGEKPMDFSYLNAVIKSRTFPPYDPWFAGGFINYYYFGFVIVGMPIKLLGLIPSVAYNLVIPTLFSLLALVAYSVGYNLVAWYRENKDEVRAPNPRIAGIAAALMLVVLGNLGTASMLYDGFKRIGTQPGAEPATFVVGLGQVMRGVGEFLTLDRQLPYAMDHWYWNPSRAIPPGPGEAGPITEFPFFTFLYADLHAHMISRPLTVLVIGWGLSWLLAAKRRERQRWLDFAIAVVIGGLILGALKPTNTWDYPVYWVLGVIAVLYGAWLRYGKLERKSLLEAVVTAVALIGLAQYLFQPYHHWYGLGYMEVDLWQGSHTSISAYLTVHGLFLFVIVSWMIWETREWMAATPLTELQKLRPYLGVISIGAIIFLVTIGLLIGQGYDVAVLVIPLMVWCGALILRPGLPEAKRFLLALTGIGVALTFLVEVVVLRGDISRMNTVFKFYMQVWEMFSLAAGAALAWILVDLPSWLPNWRRGWTLVLAILAFSAAFYTITATPAKIRDRFAMDAPHTLDGMAFMPYVDNYYDLGKPLMLDEDYRAIQWMQDNVQGSPVIIEANVPEYRWGNRFTIYTGLPGVLGWLNHQHQQRVAGKPGIIEERAMDILNFYLTRSIEDAWRILERYDVQYVILGRLERIFYEEVQPCTPTSEGTNVNCDLRGWPWGMPNPDVSPSECEPVDPEAGDAPLRCPTHGLEKFETMVASGMLSEVYRDGETVIYEVSR
jgi:YYY domain-containing protein